jgi:citrate lyase subunit beta/citryl-CoA lyase
MYPARTYLFVPGDRPERFAKALGSDADVVVLDLEDAVQPPAKVAAREAVSQFLATTDALPRIAVRINDQATGWFDGDLQMLAARALHGVMLPKAERTDTLARVHAVCPGAAILALVESARGVLASEALAAAPGVQRLVFGTIDFALDLDLIGNQASTLGLDYAASRLALASRAAGIASPVAGVTVAIDDEALLLAELARARAHGFGAKLCIHPKQVGMIHAALRPTETELAWARRVMAAAEGAPGAVQLDGRMVDKPVIERARRLMQRAAD